MRLRARTLVSVIDRYIASNFLAYFLVCAFAIVGLVLTIQTFAALHKFVKYGFLGMLQVLGIYYLYSIPIILADIFPVMILIGASYCLVAMSKDNEMVALKASGVSLYRIMLPIFVAATIIAILAAANQEWLLPGIGQEFENFSRDHGLSRNVLHDKYGDAEQGCLKYRIYEFDVETAAFRKGDFWRFSRTTGRLTERMNVDSGEWKGEGKWLCRGMYKNTYLESGELENEYFEEYVLQAELTPDDLLQDDLQASYRNIASLRKRIRLEPERIDLKLAFHNRFTQPLSALILLLIGLPPVVGSERFSKNRVLGIGVSLIVGGAFYLVSFVCDYLGNHQYIPTAGLAAWVPVVMFGALGIYFFDAMRT